MDTPVIMHTAAATAIMDIRSISAVTLLRLVQIVLAEAEATAQTSIEASRFDPANGPAAVSDAILVVTLLRGLHNPVMFYCRADCQWAGT